MKKTTIFLVLATLCLNFTAMAQASDNVRAKDISPIQPLKIGDKLPETFWQQQHTIYANGNITTQTLEKYKGKLLLLKFWATWCGSCMAKFPLLDSLNQLDMKVLLVSSKKAKEGFAHIDRFFKANPIGQKYPQPTVIDDEVLAQLFPFKQIPHYVWIDYQGRLIAITNYLFPSVELAQQALMPQKRKLAKQEGKK